MKTENKNTENSKQPKNGIHDLIRLVDKEYKQKVLDTILHSPFLFMLGPLFLMFVLVEIYLFSINDVGKQLSIAIPFSALIIVFFDIFIHSFEEALIKRNYDRISEKIENNQKPLVKALIKMKVKNYEISLEQIYTLNESMFTKEKLLEILYK